MLLIFYSFIFFFLQLRIAIRCLQDKYRIKYGDSFPPTCKYNSQIAGMLFSFDSDRLLDYKPSRGAWGRGLVLWTKVKYK